MTTTTGRRIRHAVGLALVASTLSGAAIVLTAGPAAAEGDHTPYCFWPVGPDDGPITDPVHHVVEPLLPGELRHGMHHVNCLIEGAEVPAPDYFIRDSIELVNYAVNGPEFVLPLVGRLPKLPALLPGFKLPGGWT